jgi:lysozyme
MSTPKVVDLSRYQSGFNFTAFAMSGGLAVICKASEGSTIVDSSYATFREQALAAGLKFASYHFLRSGDMQEQARFYLRCAEPEHGERVVADFEDDSVSLDDLVAFLKEIRSIRPSLQLTVYGSNVLEESVGSSPNDWLHDNTSLWTAAYSSSPGAYPQQVWPVWSLWQFTDNASVSGFNGSVDGDQFNGSDAQCLAWFGPADRPAPAPPHPSEPTVAITTTGNVRVIINGQVIA